MNQEIFESLDDMIAHCVKLSTPGLLKLLNLTIADIQHPRTSRQKRARAGILLLLSRQFAIECDLPVTPKDVAKAIDSLRHRHKSGLI